jgi:N-acetylneuraminic acid mutarotase
VTAAGAVYGLLLAFQTAGTGWQEAPALPRGLSGNTVATVEGPEGAAVFSFFGRSGDGTGGNDGSGSAFRWDVGADHWEAVSPAPGPDRFGATAVRVRERIVIVGGRSIDLEGPGESLARTDIYDPGANTWSEGQPMPAAMGEAVVGVWRDSLVYVVGWSAEARAEAAVHLYDPSSDVWLRATPPPGAPSSGRSGTIARDAIVIVDGGSGSPADPPAAWRGEIDPSDPTRIRWRRLSPPTGPNRYGTAAVAVGTRVVFIGGGDRPLWDAPAGSGDAKPVSGTLLYDLVTDRWRRGVGPPVATMGHGLGRAGGWLVLAGGVTDDGRATDLVWRIAVLDAIAGGG